MTKEKKYFRRILKILLYCFLGLIGLLVTLCIIVQIPFIQNYCIDKATSLLSQKLETKVFVKHFSLNINGEISLDDVYLEDQSRDTLLFAGQITIGVELPGILNKQINLYKLSLQQVNVNLYTLGQSSVWNYQYIINAFTDSLKIDSINKKDTAGSSYNISLSGLQLNNIDFLFNDRFNKTKIQVDLKKLRANLSETDINKKHFDFNEINISGLNMMADFGQITESIDTTTSLLPYLAVKKINLSQIKVHYYSTQRPVLIAELQNYIGSNIKVDMNTSSIDADAQELTQSQVAFFTFPATVDNAKSVQNNWKIKISGISLKDNTFFLNTLNKASRNGFDSDTMYANGIHLHASDILYNADTTSANIHEASFKNGSFSLLKLQTQFLMTKKSIEVNNVDLRTTNSRFVGNIFMKYPSLEKIKNHPEQLHINTEIESSYLAVTDVIWFNPKLTENTFFANKNNFASISGKITGKLNNLTGENIHIESGQQTIIHTNFKIKGLPDLSNASYQIPNIRISSGKEDAEQLIDKKILSSVNLPTSFQLIGNFNVSIQTLSAILNLKSTSGDAILNAKKNKEVYSLQLQTKNLNIGNLLTIPDLGQVTAEVDINGKGLDSNLRAVIRINASDISYNKYNYRNLTANFIMNNKEFQGEASLKDTNIDLSLSGLVNLDENNTKYKIKLTVKGADLQELHFTETDISVGITAEVDLRGNTATSLNGEAGISQVILAKEGKIHILDSLIFATINEKGKNNIEFSSAVVNLKYSGTIPVTLISKSLLNHINNYFPFTTNEQQDKANHTGSFDLTIKVKPHPVIRDVFLPSLKSFDIEPVQISFDGANKTLKSKIQINNLEYDNISITDFTFDVNSDNLQTDYKLSGSDIIYSNFELRDLLINGKIADSSLTCNISVLNKNKEKLLELHTLMRNEKELKKIYIFPEELIIAGKSWNIDPSNYSGFNKKGILIHNLSINNGSHTISINSAKEEINEDIVISFNEFSLDDISNIFKKTKTPAEGIVNGNILLKKNNGRYGIIADATINGLKLYEIPAGDLSFQATKEGQDFHIKASLKGNENNILTEGTVQNVDSQTVLDLKVQIDKLSLNLIQSIAPEQISSAEGFINGNFYVKGNSSLPSVNGSLNFNQVKITPALTGSNYFVSNENILLHDQKLTLRNFTIQDENNNNLEIDGEISNINTVPEFDISIISSNFQLLNTSSKKNKGYHGRLIIDSKIYIKGNQKLPVITSNIKLKGNSDFTFIVPEKKLSSNKGEDVVIFNDQLPFHPLIARNSKSAEMESTIKGYDISSTIEVDREAVLRIQIDPATNDSLIVKGETALNFSIDAGGKTTLTGTYNLYEGSYMASLESLVRKKFLIQQGSTITWSGDLTDADLNITAIYTVRASPIDLVSNQMSGMSEAEQNNYRMRIPFHVILQLKGQLLKPEIQFEIQLPPAEKGVLGGAVNSQLTLLNEDESELNKQVFALLVLGRFIQQNPLESEAGGVSTAARTSVSKFLTQQLNQLSSQIVKGVDLSFDVQSYDDFSDGSSQGRTELGVALEKKIFNDRLSVQVGGSIDVEGEKTSQNNVNDLTGDVTVEYMLTKDGRYRLKGFRHNQYEGILEGQLVETGAGILYNRDFNSWKSLFQKTKLEKIKDSRSNEKEINEK